MPYSRRRLAAGALLLSVLGSAAGVGIAGAVANQASPRTPADVHVLLGREQALTTTLAHFPGVGAGPAMVRWEASYRAQVAAQSTAVATVNQDLAASVSPPPSTSAEAKYKASAVTLPYALLVKDPSALKGRVVTYRAQVFQYDSLTGTSHFLAHVTDSGYGIWTNLIFADVNPTVAAHACDSSIIQLWGTVVGPYTYPTTLNGTNTVPEIRIEYLNVLSAPC